MTCACGSSLDLPLNLGQSPGILVELVANLDYEGLDCSLAWTHWVVPRLLEKVIED